MDEKCVTPSLEEQFPPFLNAEQISGYLGISLAKTYNLLRSSGFTTLRIGKRMLVPRDCFLAWIDEPLEKNSKRTTKKIGIVGTI